MCRGVLQLSAFCVFHLFTTQQVNDLQRGVLSVASRACGLRFSYSKTENKTVCLL